MLVGWNLPLHGSPQFEVSVFWSVKHYFTIHCTPFPPTSLLLLHCYDSALIPLQTHWTNATLVELQAQIHHDTSSDLQYGCSLFKSQLLAKVHVVLPNCLPGRKCSQETPWEHNIVECFTVPGEDRRASVEYDLYVGLICRRLHLPFLNHPDLHSCYEQSEWNWSSLGFSVGAWPGSLQAAMTSCAGSAALPDLRMHSTLCLVPLSGGAGFFNHLLG